MYKEILVVCDAQAESRASVRLALNLAADINGRITVCYLVPEEVTPVSVPAVGSPMAISPEIRLNSWQMDGLRATAEARRSEVSMLAADKNVSLQWHQEEGGFDYLAAKMSFLARIHDVCIVDGPRSGNVSGWTGVVKELIRNGGRPCFIIPRGYEGDRLASNVQICWNGSAFASRAVHDALPMLKVADKTIIVEMDEDSEGEVSSVKHIQLHLERHGVAAHAHKISSGEASVAEGLVDHAVDEDCSLLVMGMNSRPWLGRLMFGSVIDESVKDPRLPIFTSN